MHRKTIVFFAALLLLAASASALTITGKVKNGTTGKPAVGDKVDLLSMQQGMAVLATTKTDGSGSFSFNVSDAGSPHLIRVTHEGVGYFPASGPLQPGTNSTTIEVYDASSKLDDISANVDVVRLQSDGSSLQAMELLAVKNGSNPPRALNGSKTYEFYLPQGAQVDEVLVQAPGGMPINSSVTPEGNGKYSFNFPLKPGETRFEVAYHLPYSGKATFTPKMTANVQHFVVMMPKSMTFAPKNGAQFSPMDAQGATVQVATNVTPASNLAFEISGTGVIQDDQNSQAQTGGDSQSNAMADNRPGGGLGPPEDAPDPLHSYRWPILAGLGVVLVCSAVFVISRTNQQAAGVAPTPAMAAAVSANAGSNTPPAQIVAAPIDKTTMLLEGLKDELFQLEVEKQEGRISDTDYESAKAALNETLKRALSRKN